jgi:hypothetical protein
MNTISIAGNAYARHVSIFTKNKGSVMMDAMNAMGGRMSRIVVVVKRWRNETNA